MTSAHDRYLEQPDYPEGCAGCEPGDVEWSEKWDDWIQVDPVIIQDCELHDPDGDREGTVSPPLVTENSAQPLD